MTRPKVRHETRDTRHEKTQSRVSCLVSRVSLVTRFAPSPTGAQHVGNARTYLIAWLSVRSRGGRLVLRVEDIDSPRVKAGAESRLLLMWGRPNEDEQIRLVQGMAAFWRYAETLVASRAEHPRDDFTSDLLLARDGDLPALNHQG